MNGVNEADNKLIKRVIDLTRLNQQDTGLLEGYRNIITQLNEEIRAHEYNDLMLQEAQLEILRCHKELGR